MKTGHKAHMLQFQLEKKLLSVTLDGGADSGKDVAKYMQLCFNSLNEQHRRLTDGNGSGAVDAGQANKTQQVRNEIDQFNAFQVTYKIRKQAKVLLKLARFADKILRKLKGEGDQGKSQTQ